MFLDKTGIYEFVIAGVPPTTSAYNAAAQSTYPGNIGLWVRGQALRNTQRTLCAGSGCPGKWVRPSAFGSMDAKHKINTQYIQHKESMKVYVQNKKEACLKKTISKPDKYKIVRKDLNEPDGSPAESPSVDDLPTRGRKRVTESPPDFSGKSGNRIKHFERFWKSCRLRVGKTGHPHDAPPKRVLRPFRTFLKFIRLENLLDIY